MENRFNRCCCPTESPDFACNICFLDCRTTDLQIGARTIHVVQQEHPDGEEGHFGKVQGQFRLNGTNAAFIVYYDFNAASGAEGQTSFVRFQAINSAALEIRFGFGTLQLDVGNTKTVTAVEFGLFGSLFDFCVHFDGGNVSVVLFNGIRRIAASASYEFGNHAGGSVGFRTVADASGSIRQFDRAQSESNEAKEIYCPGCASVTCDPCCPEPATGGWVVTIGGLEGTGLTDGGTGFPIGYGDCGAINRSYILDSIGDTCRWRTGFANSGYWIDFEGTVEDPIRCLIQDPEVFLTATIVNSGTACSLRLILEFIYPPLDQLYPDPSVVDCGEGVIAEWRATGTIGQLCQGTHVLVLHEKNESPREYCINVPNSVTMHAL